jgi:hypothetical protein
MEGKWRGREGGREGGEGGQNESTEDERKVETRCQPFIRTFKEAVRRNSPGNDFNTCTRHVT